jgi:hypothetical protein
LAVAACRDAHAGASGVLNAHGAEADADARATPRRACTTTVAPALGRKALQIGEESVSKRAWSIVVVRSGPILGG